MLKFTQIKNCLLLILAVLIIPNILFAQKEAKIASAKQKMEHLEFAKAIQILEPIGIKGSKKMVPELLGDCYMALNEPKEATFWYGKALENLYADAERSFVYAKALQQTGRYRDAAQWYRNHLYLQPKNEIAGLNLETCMDLDQLESKAAEFNVSAVKFNSEKNEFGAVFYKNEIVFTSDRPIPFDETTFKWTGGKFLNLFKKHRRIEEVLIYDEDVNTAYNDGPASFSKDGRFGFFTRNQVSQRKFLPKLFKDKHNKIQQKITSAVFDVSTGEWVHFKDLPFTDKEYSYMHPALSADGKTLYFVSNMIGGYGGFDIWKVDVDLAGQSYGVPENLGAEINTTENELFPFVSDRGDLYFSSSTLGGFGGLDIYVAYLNENGFSKPGNLGQPVNGPADDFSFYYSEKHNCGFIASNREGGKGGDDIYKIRRLGKLPKRIEEKVLAKKESQEVESEKGNDKSVIQLINEAKATNQPLAINTEEEVLLHKVNGKLETVPVTSTTIIADLKPVSTTRTEFKTVETDEGVQLSLKNILFDLNSAKINQKASTDLELAKAFIKSNPNTLILIAAHTDARGSDTYNMKLSDQRANSVVKYLVANGIDENRLIAKGYGESKLLNSCVDGVPCDETAHLLNRRVEFTILKQGITDAK